MARRLFGEVKTICHEFWIGRCPWHVASSTCGCDNVGDIFFNFIGQNSLNETNSLSRSFIVTVSSMTGFAQAIGKQSRYTWVWEAKSVNARGLDVRVRLPNGLEINEAVARVAAFDKFKRGSVSLALTLEKGDEQVFFRINEEMLQQILNLQLKLVGKVSSEPIRLDVLLQLRGLFEIVNSVDEAIGEIWADALEPSLCEVLEALQVSRASEGKRLSIFVDELLNRIESLCRDAADSAAAQPAAIKAKLKGQLDELLLSDKPLLEERLAHEVALLAAKADLREELDRLSAHIDAARGLLKGGGPIGRQLDFLCQEFNREANTLCSKASDIKLTRIGLELKTAIDQMREQIQNIE